MAIHPLSTAWAKYNWANKHMERVAEAIERSVEPNVHPVAVDVNLEPPHGNIAVVRVTKLPNLRTDYGLRLGDAIQNFRAALDHLAWALVKLGSDPNPKRPQDVFFPTARSGQHFHSRIGQWLPGVSEEDRALIRRYQPYRRGDAPKAIRWLRDLSNTDKHRVLIPAIVSLGDAHLQVIGSWPLQRIDHAITGRRALKVGTPLMRVRLWPVLGTQCQVQVQGNIACFPSIGYGVAVGDALAAIRSTVFEILDTFENLI